LAKNLRTNSPQTIKWELGKNDLGLASTLEFLIASGTDALAAASNKSKSRAYSKRGQ